METLPKEIKNLIWEYLPARDAAQFALTAKDNNLKPTLEQAYIPFTIKDLAQLMFKTYKIGIYLRQDYNLYPFETNKGIIYVYQPFSSSYPTDVATTPDELISLITRTEAPICELISDLFDKYGITPIIKILKSRKNCYHHMIPCYRRILLEWVKYSVLPYRIFNSISRFLTIDGKNSLVYILNQTLPGHVLETISTDIGDDNNEITTRNDNNEITTKNDKILYMSYSEMFLDSLIDISISDHITPKEEILKITRDVLEQLRDNDFDYNKF